MDLLSANALDFRVLAVSTVLFNLWQKLHGLSVGLADLGKSTVLIVKHLEFGEL